MARERRPSQERFVKAVKVYGIKRDEAVCILATKLSSSPHPRLTVEGTKAAIRALGLSDHEETILEQTCGEPIEIYVDNDETPVEVSGDVGDLETDDVLPEGIDPD